MLLRVCCLLFICFTVLADTPMSLTWPMLRPVKGQWKISYAITSGPDKNAFVPHNCSSQLQSAPCNKPPMTRTNDDRIKVTFVQKNASAPFTAFNKGVPEQVAVMMCYSPHSFLDRPWRKFKKVINKDKNCAYTIGKKMPFPTNPLEPTTVTMDFNSTTDLVTATWYVKVVVFCKDGSKAGTVCQFDETNTTNSNFFATKKVNPISTGMIAAAAILSSVGPTFFLIFYFLDARRRKNM